MLKAFAKPTLTFLEPVLQVYLSMHDLLVDTRY